MADYSQGQENAIELVDGILSGVGLASYRDVLSALERAAASAGYQYMSFETRQEIESALSKARGQS